MENLDYLKLRKISFLVLIGCLAAIFFSSLNLVVAKTRDVKRRADIKILTEALDLFHDRYGYYPESSDDWQGWNLTYKIKGNETNFLGLLEEWGFINKSVQDPINDANFHYRYQKYSAGSFGCAHPFYILQILSFELPTENIGRGICPQMNWAETAINGYTVQAFD